MSLHRLQRQLSSSVGKTSPCSRQRAAHIAPSWSASAVETVEITAEGKVFTVRCHARRFIDAEVGLIKVPVRRTGNLSLSVHVDYSCRDGTAKKGEDYEALTLQV